LWQDNSTNASFTVTEPGNYSVVVKTANGCTDSTAIEVVISHNCDDILFPTAFSPNGDGLNDNFGPLPLRNLALLKNYTLRIYNRYGQVVFSSTNPYEKWDGGQKGQPADTGSYMWRAEYIYDTGNSLKKSGSVTIVH
jgi:gliding motility-associated-like protein